jgi:hypothetical protein
MTYSITALRADLYRLLDQVLETGVPIEVERNGRRLRIVAVESTSRLDRIRPMPGLILGDPDDIVHMDWSGEWRP